MAKFRTGHMAQESKLSCKLFLCVKNNKKFQRRELGN
jgi:hypothetical protein